MAEASQIMYKLAEVVEVLVKKEGIHQGHWGIAIKFGFGAINTPGPQGTELLPSAIVPVMEIGLQKFDVPNGATVDAAEVNPARAASGAPRSHSARRQLVEERKKKAKK